MSGELTDDLSLIFPDPEEATEEGLLCVGGDLSVSTLLSAYSKGIFPWPQPGYPLLWFSPPERGVIDFAELHVPRSLSRVLSREQRLGSFNITFDRDFDSVIRECATAPRPGESGTWILPEMVSAYREFHRAGHAHSVEMWSSGGELVGGVYGVFVRGIFSGESMFYRQPNASKICLLALIERLRASGVEWMDTQMVTPVVEQLGGKYIDRSDFLQRLAHADANVVVDWTKPFKGFKS